MVIDFSRAHRTLERENYKVTPEQEAKNWEEYQKILTAINRGRKIELPRSGEWTSPTGLKFKIGEAGNLSCEMPDIPRERIARAVEIMQEVQTRSDFEPSHFFRHPELADLNSVVLKKRIDEYLQEGAVPDDVRRRKTSWTLDELYDTDFPELEFLVDSIVPQGLALLVAAPKVGKSYWLACLIVCLLWDIPPFGRQDMNARGCDVLLVTPDDPSARRLKNRILSIAEDQGLKREDRKHDLFIEEEWAPIEDGGAEDLDAWLRDHPDCKAVFVDTLDRLRDGGGSNWMKADERAMAALKMIADAHGVTVVGTHHDRKNKDTDDVLDVVSGGRKITGGVDAILVLTRPRNSPYARLQVIGRDVEDVEYDMAFDYPVWALGDKAQDGDATPKQRTRKDEVLDVLVAEGKPMTAEAVYAALQEADSKMSLDNVRQTLTRLKDDGKALRVPKIDGRKGGYRAV